MRIEKPWYLIITRVLGYEEPTGEQLPAGEVESSEESEGEVKPSEAKTYTEEEIAGLKSALQKERDASKANAKKLAAFEKSQREKEDAEKTEIQRLTDQGDLTSKKAMKLAESFRLMKLEDAVLAAARDAKFTDPTDALRSEVLAAIGVEQDEEDPTQVQIDAASVKAAISKLAKDKPHYLGQEKVSRQPSASKFGGSGSGSNQKTAQQELMAKFPALARRSG